jgi:hypothetical protein
MRLYAIYIFPLSVSLFCWRKYVDRSWDYINRSHTEIGSEAALFPEKEYTKEIFVAVHVYSMFAKTAFMTQKKINMGVKNAEFYADIHIHVCVIDFYIPRVDPYISDSGNILISHRYMSVGTGRQNTIILFGK